MNPNKNFWEHKKVLITGHTGFKGAWLTLWLNKLGADVTGIGLKPITIPSLFEIAKIDVTISLNNLGSALFPTNTIQTGLKKLFFIISSKSLFLFTLYMFLDIIYMFICLYIYM
jgi:CDP-glucose 4,6-dehydratase